MIRPRGGEYKNQQCNELRDSKQPDQVTMMVTVAVSVRPPALTW